MRQGTVFLAMVEPVLAMREAIFVAYEFQPTLPIVFETQTFENRKFFLIISKT